MQLQTFFRQYTKIFQELRNSTLEQLNLHG